MFDKAGQFRERDIGSARRLWWRLPVADDSGPSSVRQCLGSNSMGRHALELRFEGTSPGARTFLNRSRLAGLNALMYNGLWTKQTAPAQCYNKNGNPIALIFMNIFPKFWPLDYDPEDEIYESVSWDLPGFQPSRGSERRSRRPERLKKRR